MTRTFVLAVLATFVSTPQAAHDYAIRAVSASAVTIDDQFWAPKLEIEPHGHDSAHPAGERDDRPRRQISRRRRAGSAGEYEGRRFNDTDIYKIIEAASYSLALVPIPRLTTQARRADRAHRRRRSSPTAICFRRARSIRQHPAPGRRPRALGVRERQPRAVQRRPSVRGGRRAFQATGKRTLLDVAIKNADLVRGDIRSEGPPGRAGPRGDRARRW